MLEAKCACKGRNLLTVCPSVPMWCHVSFNTSHLLAEHIYSPVWNNCPSAWGDTCGSTECPEAEDEEGKPGFILLLKKSATQVAAADLRLNICEPRSRQSCYDLLFLAGKHRKALRGIEVKEGQNEGNRGGEPRDRKGMVRRFSRDLLRKLKLSSNPQHHNQEIHNGLSVVNIQTACSCTSADPII